MHHFKEKLEEVKEKETRDLLKKIIDIVGIFTPRIGIAKNKLGKD